MNAELQTKTSILPKVWLIFRKASSTCLAFVMSVGTAKTSVPGNSSSMACLVARRFFSVRLIIAILVLPPAAKAFAMLAPMPLPPPVITTVLCLTESSGRDGDIAGYDLLCDSLVRDGKNEEAAIFAGGLERLSDMIDVA